MPLPQPRPATVDEAGKSPAVSAAPAAPRSRLATHTLATAARTRGVDASRVARCSSARYASECCHDLAGGHFATARFSFTHPVKTASRLPDRLPRGDQPASSRTKPLPPIAEGMCQEQSPLSVTSILVNGRLLPLSVPAIFNCEMASDLPGWVADVDNYIFAMQKTRIKAVTVGGSYECRDRNVEGGSSDLSEHGRADALDFVGFTLEDGRTLTVGQDYNSPDAPTNRLMHFAHDAACTRFTTVLGPDANALHHDHFHLDLGCHGQSCTYRLCE